ncbi:MAG: phosphatase PAP2 family protein [Treponema sp.]|nr:phosphatase PAP2 family protein [Treponema sp.]
MDYLYALQQIREACPSFVNYFFLFFSEVILKAGVLFIAVIYWSFSKHDGLLIGFGYVSSYSINQTVKNIACVPRPWLLDSRLHVDPLAQKGATGFSFPSGHTVTAASTFGGIAVWKKNRKSLIVFMALICLIVAFARNWLGCHTLSDVLVALFIGAFSICMINLLSLWFSRHQDKDVLICLTGSLLSVLILILMQIKPYSIENSYPLITDCYTSCGMTCGLLLGWLLERRFVNFSMEVSVKTKFLRALAGSLLLVFMYSAGSHIFAFMGVHFAHLVKYFLIFFVMIYLYPLIFTKIEGKKNAD